MLDNPLPYKKKYQKRSKKGSTKTSPDYVETYVTSFLDKKYIILIEHFNHVHFLKFYPHELRESKNRYKKRLNLKKTPSRIFSTCIQIVAEKIRINPDLIFGVYGTWDDCDVRKENQTSDRYELWISCAISKFDGEKYSFLHSEEYNSFFLIPKHLHNEESVDALESMLKERFSEVASEFRIPR